MRPLFLVLLGVCVTGIAAGALFPGRRVEQVASTSSDGKSVPAFLNSIDDQEHIARWRAGLDVTQEFLSYCKGMSLPNIIGLFGPADQKPRLPDKDGRFYYVFRFRPGDMSHLVSRLSHFPFSPDPLEFWITVTAVASNAQLTEAKIVDKTAYP